MKNTKHTTEGINGSDLAMELGYKDKADMREALDKMRRMKPSVLRNEALTELTDIVIDGSLNANKRILSLLRQTRNPYYYRYDGMIVALGEAEKAQLELFLARVLG